MELTSILEPSLDTKLYTHLHTVSIRYKPKFNPSQTDYSRLNRGISGQGEAEAVPEAAYTGGSHLLPLQGGGPLCTHSG